MKRALLVAIAFAAVPSAAQDTPERSHAILCVALRALSPMRSSMDLYGCPISPPPLAAGDRPCEIVRGGPIRLAYDARGRLASATGDHATRYGYDADGRLSTIDISALDRGRVRYAADRIDEWEIYGRAERFRYVLARGRVTRIETTSHASIDAPADDQAFVRTMRWRGARLVSTEARSPFERGVVQRTRLVWESGRLVRVEIANLGEGPSTVAYAVTYDDRARPVRIEATVQRGSSRDTTSSEIRYECAPPSAPPTRPR